MRYLSCNKKNTARVRILNNVKHNNSSVSKNMQCDSHRRRTRSRARQLCLQHVRCSAYFIETDSYKHISYNITHYHIMYMHMHVCVYVYSIYIYYHRRVPSQENTVKNRASRIFCALWSSTHRLCANTEGHHHQYYYYSTPSLTCSILHICIYKLPS